jgi:hypothetical protein
MPGALNTPVTPGKNSGTSGFSTTRAGPWKGEFGVALSKACPRSLAACWIVAAPPPIVSSKISAAQNLSILGKSRRFLDVFIHLTPKLSEYLGFAINIP